MLNDTFKLTLDPLYLGCTLSSSEIETETEYELLCSADQTINKRSKYGLEINSSDTNQGTPAASNDIGQEASYMTEFPASFYPSKILY